MADFASLKIPAASLTDRMTFVVRVTGIRRLRVRIFIATQLIRLAGWVSGCRTEVIVAEKE